MNRGEIGKLIQVRGFEFIRADDVRDFFFHMSGLRGLNIKDLKEGNPVEFNVVKDPYRCRPRAMNIRRARGRFLNKRNR